MLVAFALLLTQARVDDGAVVAWLRSTSIPLKAVQAGNGFDDLEPFGKLLDEVRIVGMGEPTHGTREAFLFKHRMFEYLVERRGYRVFGIEASFPDCLPIEKYIQTGEGDPEAVVHGQGFWTWDNEELLGLVQWMRAYNRTHTDRVHFVGFDMQAGASAYARVAEYWKRWREDSAPLLPEKPNAEGLASVLALLDQNKGKLVGKSGSEAFETARQCAVVGVQASKMDAEKTAEIFTALNLAVTKANEGAKELQQAGWDTKELEELLKGADEGTFGAAALRMRVSKLRKTHTPLPRGSEARFSETMRALEEVATQLGTLEATNGWRDQCMSENAAWMVDKLYPRSKAMLWAHNYHVGASVPEDNSVATMGRYLTKRFGRAYFPVGFSFGEGSFQSRLTGVQGMGPLQSFEVGAPAPGSLDETLGKVSPLFIAHLDGAPKEVRRWLDQPHATRTCGSGFDPKDPQSHYRNDRPGKWYRAMVYLGKTTRARPLPLTRERFGIKKDW
jgi:erythromycin esterase-like protein